MKKLCFLVVLGLLGAGIAHAGPVHTYVVGGCPVSDAVKIFNEAKDTPTFDLYVICNTVDWASLMAKNDLRPSETALTDWKASRIFLGPKAFSDHLHLREVITHELEHLRCHCTLGEANPHHS